jgi:tetrahydromethanopterin S-methyltransferase subunit C
MNALAKTGREGMVKAVMKCISKWGADSSQLVAAYGLGRQPVNETKSN